MKNTKFLVLNANIGFNPEIIDKIKGTDKGNFVIAVWKKLLFANMIDFEIEDKEFVVKLSVRVYTNNLRILEEKLYFGLRKLFLTGMSIFDALVVISGIESLKNNDKSFLNNTLYS